MHSIHTKSQVWLFVVVFFLRFEIESFITGTLKKNIPRYYIYHKVRNGSFVKNLGHRVYLGIFFLPETSACELHA